MDTIKNYDILYKDIEDKINNHNYNIYSLLDYIYHISPVYVYNTNFDDNTKYIDFEYYNMTCSIYQVGDDKPYLSKYVELWNDDNTELLYATKNIDELREELK